MQHIIKLYLKAIRKESYSDDMFNQLALSPGTGASGGLVASIKSIFKNCSIINGMDYISELMNLEESIINSDLIFTGEGCFDS